MVFVYFRAGNLVIAEFCFSDFCAVIFLQRFCFIFGIRREETKKEKT